MGMGTNKSTIHYRLVSMIMQIGLFQLRTQAKNMRYFCVRNSIVKTTFPNSRWW